MFCNMGLTLFAMLADAILKSTHNRIITRCWDHNHQWLTDIHGASFLCSWCEEALVQYGRAYSKYEGLRQDLVRCAYQDGR